MQLTTTFKIVFFVMMSLSVVTGSKVFGCPEEHACKDSMGRPGWQLAFNNRTGQCVTKCLGQRVTRYLLKQNRAVCGTTCAKISQNMPCPEDLSSCPAHRPYPVHFTSASTGECTQRCVPFVRTSRMQCGHCGDAAAPDEEEQPEIKPMDETEPTIDRSSRLGAP